MATNSYKTKGLSSPYKELKICAVAHPGLRRQKRDCSLPSTKDIRRPLGKEFNDIKFDPWKKRTFK